MNKKQEIQDKLEHTKKMLSSCNSNIEDYKSDAENYECEIMQLEKQLKECDELKLVDGYVSYYDGIIEKTDDINLIENGYCYPSPVLTEIADKNEVMRNKLEAYSRIIDPDWRECWDGVSKNWYLFQDVENGEYEIDCNYITKDLGKVHMSLKAATRIAKGLNSGEITL